MNTLLEHSNKLLAAMIGALWGLIYPTLAYIIVALLFIIVDNISAYLCNKRVAKKYPERCTKSKYSSNKAWKTIQTMGYTILIIVIAFTLEEHVISEFADIKITAIISCLICSVTGLSILENWSTANNNTPKWLSVLKKFLVDKTERYFDTDINNDGKIGDSNV